MVSSADGYRNSPNRASLRSSIEDRGSMLALAVAHLGQAFLASPLWSVCVSIQSMGVVRGGFAWSPHGLLRASRWTAVPLCGRWQGIWHLYLHAPISLTPVGAPRVPPRLPGGPGPSDQSMRHPHLLLAGQQCSGPSITSRSTHSPTGPTSILQRDVCLGQQRELLRRMTLNPTWFGGI